MFVVFWANTPDTASNRLIDTAYSTAESEQ
jgi:hypothetical protein